MNPLNRLSHVNCIRKQKIATGVLYLLISLSASAQSVFTTTERFGPMGTVTIYRPQRVESVVLFASGDGGWNKGVVDMAKTFVNFNALVVGIDIPFYMKRLAAQPSSCAYPASDFENLSVFIQKKYLLAEYLKPILVGYSSGATLVYGMLAQAPANTFKGALALGFCPDLAINKPLCPGNMALGSRILKKGQSYYLEAVSGLPAPFIGVVGQTDKVCNCQASQAFLKAIKNTSFIAPAGVGHGFMSQEKWLPQVETAFRNLSRSTLPVNPVPQALSSLPPGLPLTLTPSTSAGDEPLAIMLSGDGGWTSFDESLAQALVTHGIPSVGIDVQKYFWKAKTPAQTTLLVHQLVDYYSSVWHRTSFILVGYSFGASVLPFVATRLPPSQLAHLRGAMLLSPDTNADFEIRLLDMLNLGTTNPYNVLEEIKKSKSTKLFCVFGQDETSTTMNAFQHVGAHVQTIPGGHHYNNNYTLLASLISKMN